MAGGAREDPSQRDGPVCPGPLPLIGWPVSSPPHHTDIASVLTRLRVELPQFAHLEITLLGEGTDHLALDLGGQYVVRVPKREEAAAALRTEVKLLTWLAPRLPLAVPEYEFFPSGQDAASSYGGYAKLSGTPGLLTDVERTPFDVIGPTLGVFLRRLHDATVEEARALGVEDDDDPLLDEWEHDALDDLSAAIRRGYVPSDAGKRWAQVLTSRPSTERVPRRLIHGDFAAEHVLLDGHGMPTGVIDWTDTVLGDPARDLSGLLHWGGDGLLNAALETYGRVDEGTFQRARWFATCRAVADIVFGDETGSAAYVRAGMKALAWLSPPS